MQLFGEKSLQAKPFLAVLDVQFMAAKVENIFSVFFDEFGDNNVFDTINLAEWPCGEIHLFGRKK